MRASVVWRAGADKLAHAFRDRRGRAACGKPNWAERHDHTAVRRCADCMRIVGAEG